MISIKEDIKDTKFKVFSDPANTQDGKVVALRVPDGNKLSRKDIDVLTEMLKEFGAKGLAYIRVEEANISGLNSPILKYLSEKCLESILKDLKLKKGSLVFFGAGDKKTVNDYMSKLISRIGEDLNLL